MQQSLPGHVGIIPDGNRRWARRRGVSLADAYRAGYERLREVLDRLLDLGVRAVSVYAMSLDNYLKRSGEEAGAVMALALKGFRELRSSRRLASKGVEVRVIGRLNLAPSEVREEAEALEAETRGRGGPKLYIAFLYSSRAELEEAASSCRVPETARIEPIDLIIRTGGMRRISDFFPLASIYAELYFTETLWPDFTLDELERALEWYSRIPRRFGR